MSSATTTGVRPELGTFKTQKEELDEDDDLVTLVRVPVLHPARGSHGHGQPARAVVPNTAQPTKDAATCPVMMESSGTTEEGRNAMQELMRSPKGAEAMNNMMEMARRMGNGDPMLGMARMMEMMGGQGGTGGTMDGRAGHGTRQ